MAVRAFTYGANTDAHIRKNITIGQQIKGPSTFTIDPGGDGHNTGTLVVNGDLQVQGTQTNINSTTLTVDDLNITIADGAGSAAAANGAGLTVAGANATLTWTSSNDSWNFNKKLTVNGVVSATSGTSTEWNTAYGWGDHSGAGYITDLVSDTTPQLGGNLDTNGKNINFGDSATAGTDDTLQFGAGPDLRMYHDGSNSYIDHIGPDQQTLYIRNTTSTTNTTDGIVLESNNHYVHIANNSAVRFGIGGADKVSVISNGSYFNHDIILNAPGYDLKWRNGSNYVTLTASVSGNSTANLPNFDGTIPVFTTAPTSAIADGSAGHVLKTDGNGGLSFGPVSVTETDTLDSVTGRGSTTSNSISVNQLTTTIATGTAPLVVSSTTKVNNLNADKVDDKDYEDFVAEATALSIALG